MHRDVNPDWAEAQHIVVSCNAQFFKVAVKERGEWLPEAAIQQFTSPY